MSALDPLEINTLARTITSVLPRGDLAAHLALSILVERLLLLEPLAMRLEPSPVERAAALGLAAIRGES